MGRQCSAVAAIALYSTRSHTEMAFQHFPTFYLLLKKLNPANLIGTHEARIDIMQAIVKVRSEIIRTKSCVSCVGVVVFIHSIAIVR